MPSEIIEFLDNFKFGSALQFLVLWVTLFISVIAFIKKQIKGIKEKGSEETLSNLEEKEREDQLESYKTSIEKMEKELGSITSDLNSFKASIHDELQNFDVILNKNNTSSKELHQETIKTISDIASTIKKFENRVKNSELKVESMNKTIEILISSDIGSHKAWIVHEYDKWVKREGSIDLMSLQNIENIYRLYLDEVSDGGDQFITKLVQEIRNLPTKKE